MDGYFRSGLVGGTASDLDGISDASLSGGEVAWVYESETLYQYIFDETSTDVEANPTRIRPDDYDTGVWHLVSLYNGVMPAMASGVEAEGGISGLNLSLDTDTEHDINCSIGSCKDSTNAVDMVLSTTITKRIDATWVEGDDQGGLLNGGSVPVAANTYYHVYLIKDSSGTVDLAFLVAGDTLATRLSGISYTYARWLGFVRTDASSNICGFIMAGDHISWDTASESVLSSGVTTTFAAIDHTSFLPVARIDEIEYGVRDASAAGAAIYASDDGTNTSFYVGASAATTTDTNSGIWGRSAEQRGGLKPFYASREFRSVSGTIDLLVQSVVIKR